jgi:hypothetical protein
MTPERIVSLIADGARPFAIVCLSLGLVLAIFIPGASFGIATICGTLAGGLVGARSFENHSQIKATAEVAKATGADMSTTVKTVVTPAASTQTIEKASSPSPPPNSHMG